MLRNTEITNSASGPKGVMVAAVAFDRRWVRAEEINCSSNCGRLVGRNGSFRSVCDGWLGFDGAAALNKIGRCIGDGFVDDNGVLTGCGTGAGAKDVTGASANIETRAKDVHAVP